MIENIDVKPSLTVWRTIYLHDIDTNESLRGLGFGGAVVIDHFLVHYEQALIEVIADVRVCFEWTKELETYSEADDTVIYCDCDESAVPCSHHDEAWYAVTTDELYLNALASLDREMGIL